MGPIFLFCAAVLIVASVGTTAVALDAQQSGDPMQVIQKGACIHAGMIPGSDTVVDVAQAVTGRACGLGDEISWWEQVLSGFCAFLPGIGAKWFSGPLEAVDDAGGGARGLIRSLYKNQEVYTNSPTPQIIKLGHHSTLRNTVPGLTYLDNWAEHGLIDLTKVGDFISVFRDAARNSSSINFSIEELEPGSAIWRSTSYTPKPNRFTYLEMNIIVADPELLSKTTFYRGAKSLDPDELKQFIEDWRKLAR